MDIDPRLRPSDPGPRHSTQSDAPTNAAEYPDPPTSTERKDVHYAAPRAQAQPQHVYTPSASTARPIEADDPFDLKRPRACEACRQLKVRCEPDASHPTGSCRRCAKAGRNCVVTLPTRKRQKKTDSRVAELERKIDALSASLRTQGQAQPLGQGLDGRGSGMPGTRQTENPTQSHANQQGSSRRWLGAPNDTGLAGSKRHSSGEVKESSEPSLPKPFLDLWHSERQREHYDVFEKGYVDGETANIAFERYVNDLAPQLPVVVFTPGTKMEDIRRSKPILLHAILAVSISPIQPSAQKTLVTDFYKLIAERVVVKGEKSLELLQAITVIWIWYLPPDHFEELKFYQLIHMSVIMGMDIGMNRKTMSNRAVFGLLRQLIGKKPSSLNPDAPETRRAWLGCYFGSVQASVALRRSFLVHWQPYMDECLEILENSPDALPSDKMLIHLVKLTHLSEEIGVQFSTEDTDSGVSFSDPKVQYTLKAFEKQLFQWRKDVSPENYSPILRQSEHIVNLYMHEAAMHIDTNVAQATPDDNRPGPAHINALTSCLTSVHEALDAICSVDIKALMCLPTILLARTSYAMIALIKLYALASAPESKIGQVIDPASLQVEYHLDRVLNHYKAAGEQEGARTPFKFSIVLSLLRDWFVKRKDQGPALGEVFGGFCKPITLGDEVYSGNEERSQKMTTPLQLLSEVAMGDPSRGPQSQYSSRGYQSDTPSTIPPSTNQNTDSETWMQQYPSVPGLSTPQSQPQSRQFYPVSQYPDMPVPGPGANYPDPTAAAGGIPLPNTNAALGLGQGFVPELGMQVGFYPENLFALGSMLDEGFFGLPFVGGGTGEGEGGFYG